jgi:hypothetical protein
MYGGLAFRKADVLELCKGLLAYLRLERDRGGSAPTSAIGG